MYYFTSYTLSAFLAILVLLGKELLGFQLQTCTTPLHKQQFTFQKPYLPGLGKSTVAYLLVH